MGAVSYWHNSPDPAIATAVVDRVLSAVRPLEGSCNLKLGGRFSCVWNSPMNNPTEVRGAGREGYDGLVLDFTVMK